MFRTIKELAYKYDISEEDRVRLEREYNELQDASLKLVDFIGENDVNDEVAMYDGYCDTWQSSRFSELIGGINKAIKREVA